jgi:hypothetical protein
MGLRDRKARKQAQSEERDAALAGLVALTIPELAERVAVAVWGPDGPPLPGDDSATNLVVLQAVSEHCLGSMTTGSTTRQLRQIVDEGMGALVHASLVSTRTPAERGQLWAITRAGRSALDQHEVRSIVAASQPGGS